MKDKKFFLSIVAFLLLTTGLVVASILVQQRQLIEKKAAGEKSSITLPTEISVNPDVNPQFTVPVMVDTDGVSISAVDVVLDFSQALDKITLINILPEAAEGPSLKTFAPVDEPGAFNLVEVINKANATGLIEFGAVTFDWVAEEVTNSFNGTLGPANPLATLTFRVNDGATGQATISVVHTLGETTDSNLVRYETGEDILANANTLTVNIGVEATPTPTPTPTITLTPTPTPTPTTGPETGNLRFQIRFQGISGDKPVARKVRGILKQDGEEVYRNENIITENDGTGIFMEMFRNITPGTYTVFIKGPAHLQKNFGEVTLTAGQTESVNWSSFELLAGDITGPGEGVPPPDNKVEGADYGLFASLFNPFETVPPDTLADFDSSGKVDGGDYGLFASNFNPFGGGDE